ncbi:type 1 glutamine amidotransferase [Candidatus Microgenomates bacterium]|nr:MAG: type 1 glutamine amidotransferase [Candidatus Microgenomates bacterium]
MKVLIVEHAEGRAEGLSDEAEKYSMEYQIWKPYTGEKLDVPIREFSGLIIGGGPMGAYQLDEYPFFKPELKVIEEAFSLGISTLGVCLGAQIFAQMLGCKVEKNFWRRGYLDVQRTDGSNNDPLCVGIKKSFPTFQYHKDEIMELPPNSILILTSGNCTVEGFRLTDKPVWAVQSHPEIGRKKAQTILGSAYDLKPEEVNQMLEKSSDPDIEMNSKLFENFFTIVKDNK